MGTKELLNTVHVAPATIYKKLSQSNEECKELKAHQRLGDNETQINQMKLGQYTKSKKNSTQSLMKDLKKIY